MKRLEQFSYYMGKMVSQEVLAGFLLRLQQPRLRLSPQKTVADRGGSPTRVRVTRDPITRSSIGSIPLNRSVRAVKLLFDHRVLHASCSASRYLRDFSQINCDGFLTLLTAGRARGEQ